MNTVIQFLLQARVCAFQGPMPTIITKLLGPFFWYHTREVTLQAMQSELERKPRLKESRSVGSVRPLTFTFIFTETSQDTAYKSGGDLQRRCPS